MTSEQPETLRVADALEVKHSPGVVLTVETVLAAARLLREQHAEIVRLREEVLALRGEIWELRSDLELLNDR
jgi:hypothetical protein